MSPKRQSDVGAAKTKAFKAPRPAAEKTGQKRKSATIDIPDMSSSEDDEVETSRPSGPVERLADNPDSTIPEKLLNALLHHHFENKKTRIGPEATELMGKYVDTFIREALARAVYEKEQAEGGQGRAGDFLEVRAQFQHSTELMYLGVLCPVLTVLVLNRLKIWKSWRRNWH